jgi:hypothetical protein
MIKTSVETKELFAALAKAQSEMESAKKSSKNPFLKNKYADLLSIMDACLPALNANGISVSQHPGTSRTESITKKDGTSTVQVVSVETILTHSSGQWMSSEVSLYVNDVTPQGTGSGITYARRYALAAIAGVPQEDDDGEAAMRRPAKIETNKEDAAVEKANKKADAENHPAVKAALDTFPGSKVSEVRVDIDVAKAKLKEFASYSSKAQFKMETKALLDKYSGDDLKELKELANELLQFTKFEQE